MSGGPPVPTIRPGLVYTMRERPNVTWQMTHGEKCPCFQCVCVRVLLLGVMQGWAKLAKLRRQTEKRRRKRSRR